MADKPKRRPYLHEVDLMRIIFIFGVLLNHTTTAFTQQMVDAEGWAHMSLLATHLLIHFTRMGFMFMSGLVLTLNYYGRHDWPTFFKKRFAGSGWPYLLWNFLLLFMATVLMQPGFTWAKFGPTYLIALLHGDQFYMYYILVTMQLYVVFPAMMWLFRRVDRHGAILAVSALIQLAVVATIKYGYPHIDRSGWPWWFAAYGVNVFTYQFYFIFGAFTARHYQAVVAFIRRHIRPLATITGLMSIGTVPYYFWNRQVLGLTHDAAVSPHQPYMFIYDTVMICFVFWVGLQYADWRQRDIPPRVEWFVKTGSKVSFGIYLDQTIGLTLLRALLVSVHVPDWGYLVLIPVGYVFVLAVSFGIAYFCYKVPPFGLLIGRPQWHILKKNRKGAIAHDRTQSVPVSPTTK